MGSGAQFFFLGQSWQNVGVKLGVLETPVDFFRENRQTIGIVYGQIVWTKPQAEQTVTNPSIWTIFKLFTVNKVWFTHKVGAVSTGLSRTLVHLIRGTCE